MGHQNSLLPTDTQEPQQEIEIKYENLFATNSHSSSANVDQGKSYKFLIWVNTECFLIFFFLVLVIFVFHFLHGNQFWIITKTKDGHKT